MTDERNSPTQTDIRIQATPDLTEPQKSPPEDIKIARPAKSIQSSRRPLFRT